MIGKKRRYSDIDKNNSIITKNSNKCKLNKFNLIIICRWMWRESRDNWILKSNHGSTWRQLEAES